jgi:hypothetical protein
MSGNNELLQALQYLGQSGKEYGLSLAINQANEQAKALKGSMMDDMERRTALSNLADDIAARMAGAGAQGQHIASVAQSIKPVMASSAEQAIMLGAQNGDRGLMKIGQDVQAEEDKRKMYFLEEQAKRQEARDYRLAGFQSDLADKKMEAAEKRAQKAPKALDTATIDKITAVQTNGAALSKVLTDVDRYSSMIGPVAGRGSFLSEQVSPGFASFQMELGQFFDAYRIAVTGAGASPGEIKMLMKNVPSTNDRPATIKAKIKTALAIGNRRLQTGLENYGRAGRDITGFTDLMVPQGKAPTGPAAADLSLFLED